MEVGSNHAYGKMIVDRGLILVLTKKVCIKIEDYLAGCRSGNHFSATRPFLGTELLCRGLGQPLVSKPQGPPWSWWGFRCEIVTCGRGCISTFLPGQLLPLLAWESSGSSFPLLFLLSHVGT